MLNRWRRPWRRSCEQVEVCALLRPLLPPPLLSALAACREPVPAQLVEMERASCYAIPLQWVQSSSHYSSTAPPRLLRD